MSDPVRQTSEARSDSSKTGEPREIGVGMLGYGFMGRAHSGAFKQIRHLTWPPPLVPRLVAICGRSSDKAEEAARRFSYERWLTDAIELATDPEVELFDNGAPNSLHAEPTIAAARLGKHVFCEKPLGRGADESYEIWRQVAATGVRHMCGFNYRFIPAVRLARELIDAGEIGEIRHFRGRYLQDWGSRASHDPWRFDPEKSGAGALGDIASHTVDLAHFLAGEIGSVSALVRTFIPGREVDDAVEAAIEFASGAVGTIEATRVALGRRNALQWEINGTKGSLAFDVERLNELRLYEDLGGRTSGWKTLLVTGGDYPFARFWWPPGHILAWGDSFVHELHHYLGAIAGEHEVTPYGASFEDGYRAVEVCETFLRSSRSGKRQQIEYRTL